MTKRCPHGVLPLRNTMLRSQNTYANMIILSLTRSSDSRQPCEARIGTTPTIRIESHEFLSQNNDPARKTSEKRVVCVYDLWSIAGGKSSVCDRAMTIQTCAAIGFTKHVHSNSTRQKTAMFGARCVACLWVRSSGRGSITNPRFPSFKMLHTDKCSCGS